MSGAALTVFTLGALLYLSAGAAAGTVDGIITVLRFLALLMITAAAVATIPFWLT